MSISFLTGGMRRVAARGLGDVDGQVADAFEVGVDLDRGDNRAQVGGHRLVQREQLEAAVVHLDVQLVDRLVAVEHAVDGRDVAADQPVHRGADALLREAAHLEQPPWSASSSSWKCRTTRSTGSPVSGSGQWAVGSKQRTVRRQRFTADCRLPTAHYPNLPVK